ncbi:DUF2207 domain-containing protein [Clostridium sp. D2Q-14]|nr:DUF2207 domain-containing protein [Anaeromonas gelatinilytica]
MTTWEVEANLLKNGDLNIVEDITFKFNDEFNGVFREIILEKTSGVTDINIKEISKDTSTEYTQVDDAENGDQGVFVIDNDSNKKIVQIFSPSKNQQKTFRLSYLVKDVAIKYNDIGELYYKFLGSENKTPIDSFTVDIQLAKKDIDNKVKLFAHGPLNGKISRKTNDIFNLHVNDVPRDTFIEGRILFPKEFIPLSNNIVDKNNYSNILEEEASLQKDIEKKNERKKAIGNILEDTSIIVSILGLALFIILFAKFRRKKDFFENQQYNNIPEDCTPAIATYLTNKTINPNTIIATILDLFRKGYIKVCDGKEMKNKKSVEKDFIITKMKEPDDYLLSHEKHFIDWLINKIGNKESVTTQEIKEFSDKNNAKFTNYYSEWVIKIKENTISKGYFDKSKNKYGLLLILSFTILLLIGIFTIVYGSLFGLTSIIISTILLIYGISFFFRYSDYGYNQYKNWKEFKKYMKTFKNYSSIDDFNKYSLDISLIYSLSLGIDKKILQKFNINKEDSKNNSSYNNSWIYWYFLLNTNNNNMFDKSINSSFGETINPSSGGNFSAGGGGGAGGGGAGGF